MERSEIRAASFACDPKDAKRGGSFGQRGKEIGLTPLSRPCGGAHNPTLTAQALAWRTAEHLTGSWKAIAGG